MKHIIVWIMAIAVAGTVAHAQEQMPVLRQGISVQMATTSSAHAFPEADNQDAWIVAITAEGRLFFGVKPVTLESLLEAMKATPRRRDQSLYVKADGRTSFGNIEKVLGAAKIDWFESAVLLTNQNEGQRPGTLVTPKGLEVVLGAAPSDSILVRVRSTGQPSPAVTVNDQEVSLSDLQTMLNRALQNRSTRVIRLQADDGLGFAQVAQVIDACNSVKAKVSISAE